MEHLERIALVRDRLRQARAPIAQQPSTELAAAAVVDVEQLLVAAERLHRYMLEAAPTAAPELDLANVVDTLREIEYLVHAVEIRLGLVDAANPTFEALFAGVPVTTAQRRKLLLRTLRDTYPTQRIRFQ